MDHRGHPIPKGWQCAEIQEYQNTEIILMIKMKKRGSI